MKTFVEVDMCKYFLVSIKVDTRMLLNAILSFPQTYLRSVSALLCFHQLTQSAPRVLPALSSLPSSSTKLKVSIVFA